MRPTSRERVCPTHSQFHNNVECPCQHIQYTGRNAKCTLVAPPRTILELAGRSAPQRAGETAPMYLYYPPVPTSVYPNHCRPRCIRATPLWTVNWTQGVKTAVRETPYRAWGWRRDLDKIFEIGKGFVGLLETDLRNCSTTKCFKRGKR